MKSKFSLFKNSLILTACGSVFPLVGLSCGVVKNTIDDSAFSIAISFEDDSKASKAAHKIVEAYNRYVDEQNQKNDTKLIKAKVMFVTNSYAGTVERISNLLRTNNLDEVPSLLINRPSSISVFRGFDKALDLNLDVENSLLIKDVAEINRYIQGADPNKTWAINTGIEEQILAVNAPLLSVVLETFQKVGTKIAPAREVRDFVEKVKLAGRNDKENAQAKLGELTDNPEVLRQIKSLVFDQREFETLAKFLEFVQLIKAAFPKYKHKFFGIDDPAYFFYGLLFAELEHQNQKMPMRVTQKSPSDTENQKYDLSQLFDPNSEAHQKFREIFNLIKPLVPKKLVWLPTKEDSYGSAYISQHNMIFNYSNTASYEFLSGGEETINFDKNYQLKDEDLFLFRSLEGAMPTLNLLNIQGVDKLLKEGQKRAVVAYYLDLKNKRVGRVYEEFYANEADIAKEDLLFTKESTRTLERLLVRSDPFVFNDFALLTTQDSQVNSVSYIKNRNLVINKKLVASPHTLFVNAPDSLQPSELLALPPISKAFKKTKYKALHLDGAVLAGIKTSKVRDENALEFAKWFVTTKSFEALNEESGEFETINTTPLDYYAVESNFVVPNKEQLHKRAMPLSKAGNSFYEVSFNHLKKVTSEQEKNYKTYREPSGLFSSPLRYAIRDSLGQLGDPNYTFDKFLQDIKVSLSSLQDFEG